MDRETPKTLKDPLPSQASDAVVVTVDMFGRTYEIKSDNPALVKLLAEKINCEAQRLKEMHPHMGPGYFDWPVQVAFQMALGLYNSKRDLNVYKSQIDDECGALISLIEVAFAHDGPY
ncbi:MAG: hypothetical protein ACRCTY_02590 [Candidatus Adiutrix sp.]